MMYCGFFADDDGEQIPVGATGSSPFNALSNIMSVIVTFVDESGDVAEFWNQERASFKKMPGALDNMTTHPNEAQQRFLQDATDFISALFGGEVNRVYWRTETSVTWVDAVSGPEDTSFED